MGLLEVVKARGVGWCDKAQSLQYSIGCKSELTMRSNSVFNHVFVVVLVLMFLFVLLNSLKQLCKTVVLVVETPGLVCKMLMWTADAHSIGPGMRRLQSGLTW